MKTKTLISKPETQGVIAVIVCLLFWASAFVGIRIGLHSYTPGPLALLRYLVGSALITFIYYRLPKRTKPTGKEILQLLLIGVIGIGIYNICLNYGEITITAGIASFIVGLIPVLSLILAIFFLKETVYRRTWFGVVISLGGLSLLAYSEIGSPQKLLGILAIFGAVIAGSILTISQKPLLKKFHPIEVATFAIWGATLFLLIYTPELIQILPQVQMKPTLAAIYLGIFPGVISYIAWSYGLSKLPASKVVPFMYLSPLVTTLLGWVMLGEFPAWLSLTGGCIALIGALVAKR